MTITLVATPDPEPTPDYDPQTPIFAQMMAERGHRQPGTLTESQEEEMRQYAAQVAQQRDPQVLPSKVLEEMSPQPVHVITVVPLATRLPDPEPIPDSGPVPPTSPEEPEDALEAPAEAVEEVKAPEAQEDSAEAVTALLERIDPKDSPVQALVKAVDLRQGLDGNAAEK